MRFRILGAIGALALFAPAAASASAAYPHVVSAGESLSSVAAADGLSVDQLAAQNGLSTDTQLVAGTTLLIPPQDAAASSSGAGVSSTPPASSDSSSSNVSTGTGGYVVQPGDTLWGIASRSGISVDALAASNGLDPNGYLISGSSISIPGASAGTPTYVSTVATPPSSGGPGVVGSGSGPYPTAETVTAPEVGSIASANGVPSSLADAIGWQESGFNNDLVSSTGAVGVMQIEPGTWDWIQRTLGAGTLNPSSAADNVRAGSLYLHSLLAATGSPSLAAAGYYQGLASVQANGVYSDTQNYVNSVMALQQRFGGG